MAKSEIPGNQVKPGAESFSVDAALLFQLGEELVNRRSVALAELIKNAYDADAQTVTLTLSNVLAPGGTIEIADDGSGLSLQALRDRWLRIATRAKAVEPFSPVLNRARAGAKGVGRFAARRLATQLHIDSVARSEDHAAKLERITATFDWAQFKPGMLLDEVRIPFTHELFDANRPNSPRTGMRLRLSGVREAWTVEDVNELQSDLLRLVTPPKKGEANDFQVHLKAPEFPSLAGNVADRFLEYALIRLQGEVASDGTVRYQLMFRDGTKKKFDPAKDGPKAVKTKSPSPAFANVGPARFDISFFVYKSTFFAGLPIKTRDAQQRGREHGGVHIYVDRFRVPPYGDIGDDWLNLDEDRGGRLVTTPEMLSRESGDIPGRPMLLLPGNNQLFGSVHLTRVGNPSLQQTVNRERFIENVAFDELRAFVRLGIDWMTVQYAAYLAAERDAAPKTGPIELLQKARTKFVETIDGSGLADEERTEVVQAFDLAMHAVQARQDELISELSMLRVLASTGTMIAVFEHQLMASLSGLTELAGRVRKIVLSAPSVTRKKLEGETGALAGWISDLKHQGNLIGLLLSKDARSRRRRVVVRNAFQTVAESFSSFMKDNDIAFVNDVPANLKTPSLYPAELTAVLLNLFTNALKAVRHETRREILATGERATGQLILRLSDTGVGADPAHWEDYFLPFNSTSTPDPMLGHGTGLGLKIVRDMAAVYGGTARFVAPRKPWSTTLEVALPES